MLIYFKLNTSLQQLTPLDADMQTYYISLSVAYVLTSIKSRATTHHF